MLSSGHSIVAASATPPPKARTGTQLKNVPLIVVLTGMCPVAPRRTPHEGSGSDGTAAFEPRRTQCRWLRAPTAFCC